MSKKSIEMTPEESRKKNPFLPFDDGERAWHLFSFLLLFLLLFFPLS